MKILRLMALCLALGSVTLFTGCGDDDDTPVSRINFAESAYDANGITLDPITVTLTLSPAAAGATTIGINITGNTDGLTFNPALSGSSLEIPVAAGDESVSFTVSFTRANLPSENLQVTMDLGELGPNLNTGITTSANINVPFIDLVTLPYAETFGDECVDGSYPPAGWLVEDPAVNLDDTGSWRCITGAEDVFVITGAGNAANGFVGGSSDTSPIESWLISPVLGPITSTSTLTFGADRAFNDVQDGFIYYDVVISTDYNGLNFESANWERFQAGFDAIESNTAVDPPGSFNAVNDITLYEDLSLADFEGEAITVAFIYKCSRPSNCALLRIDDFSVEN